MSAGDQSQNRTGPVCAFFQALLQIAHRVGADWSVELLSLIQNSEKFSGSYRERAFDFSQG
jgi:hypothetical protein